MAQDPYYTVSDRSWLESEADKCAAIRDAFFAPELLNARPSRNTEAWYVDADGCARVLTLHGILRLNSSGTAIWRAVDGRRRVRDICDHCNKQFVEPPPGFEADVRKFLSELYVISLVEVDVDRERRIESTVLPPELQFF